ncbi:hypothetical protein [Micromonospora sp. C95]|uniref:hypothetical protein n=1 Tax=Micromonospora sp. C95 TaxID=2824882 RepID=UPI001B3762FF|nr:hypothetical protein [Micromonospora sp. C95]MBQ1023816.1 hypothetical protein [Micromonospora sp. C95]
MLTARDGRRIETWRLGTAIAALSVVVAVMLPAPAMATSTEEAAASQAAADELRSYIYNRDAWIPGGYGIGIGVISEFDGRYVHGSYDAVLPAKRRTDTWWGWPRAEGVYVGPGWCVNVTQWKGGRWSIVGTKYPGIHYLGPIGGEKVARYMIDALRC